MPNRLAKERSPYLLQHANNPVDWHAWGPEAFDRATAEDKPIFLSIGYSTCHWCHVMEHESFEDESVAAVLNREFVSIKVDREERPDVDRVYMMFVQSMTGAGGWPMSVWLTPDLKPFFGGTYFPPTSKWGRPGFIELLQQLADAWRAERGQVTDSAESMLERLREASAQQGTMEQAGLGGTETFSAGISSYAQTFDRRFGGFGGAPKFPRPSELVFLLRAHAYLGDRPARDMALETLRAMALGGMHDQIGGGFHRYSVDAQWRVPHFEKMLYDQAQLVLAYLDAHQVSGESFYGAMAEDTLDYVGREMTSPHGAFFSAEDADSLVPDAVVAPGLSAPGTPATEKREGAFYVWTAGELSRVLGDGDAAICARRFGVESSGNALADPQSEFVGQNILYVAQPIDDIAVRTGTSTDDVMVVLGRARQKLFEARAARPRPHLDDKILTAWNGLMIAAFARAARVMVDSPRRDEWRDAAERAARWVRANLYRPETKTLLRRHRDNEAAIDGFCEDYAYLVFGLLELFQATGAGEWLEWALELTETETSLFFDARDGGWFSTTGQDESVLLRLKEDYDGAEPAAASLTTSNLIVLGHLVSDTILLDRARRTLERYGPHIGRAVRVMPFMVSNLVLWHAGGIQVVITGEPGADDTAALERIVAKHYVPTGVFIPIRGAQANAALAARLPWLAAMKPQQGRATAYVCHNFTCQEPTTDPEALNTQIEAAKGAGTKPRIYLT